MDKQFWIFVALLFGLQSLANASAPEQLLQAGHKAYQDKDYPAAISRYEAVRDAGYESVALWYNLGNAHYKNGDLAAAVLHYRRAQRLAPKNQQVRSNLQLVQDELGAPVVQIRQSATVRLWNGLAGRLRARGWAWLGILLLWIGASGLAAWKWGSSRTYRKAGFFLGLLALLAAILPLSLSYSRAQQEYLRTEAVVMSPEASLYLAPDSISEQVRELVPGEILEVTDELSGWYKVRLGDTTAGWLPKDVVAVV